LDGYKYIYYLVDILASTRQCRNCDHIREEFMTQKHRHIPGPWIIAHSKGEFDNAYWIGPEKHFTIARVENGANDAEYGGPDAELANARLIAAAPRLLRVAEIIEAAYAEGPANTFHTRLRELSGGEFAEVLLGALNQVRGDA
jgi:hypothetical protein